MLVANFDEFNQYIDSLFAKNSITDFASYSQALLESKGKRKAQIALTSQKINSLLRQIKKARAEIKQATNLSDKKAQGQALNSFITAKQELVKQYNRQKNATLFNELSNDAKIYACAKSLLLKYIPQELNSSPYLYMPKDDHGNLLFLPNKIKETPLDRDIHHIIDYVTSYLENYPEKVRGAKHFTGLYKQCVNMKELIEEIDAYFEKINSPSEKEANRIKKSHSGYEVVMDMPEHGLQVVRLLTKPALQYEGSAMHHCVGSYASKVEKGETNIYSVRVVADKTSEMIPVATIEYKDNQIKQIKGPHDREISFAYLQPVRDFIVHLTGKKDFSEVAKDETIGDKKNIGLIKDSSEIYRDIYSMIEDENYCFDSIGIEGASLRYIPTDHLTTKILTVNGKLRAEDLKYLSHIKVQSEIEFSNLNFDGKHLDLSNFAYEKITLDFDKAENLETLSLSDNTTSLTLSGEALNLKDINAPNLQELTPHIFAPQMNLSKLNLSEINDMFIYVNKLSASHIDLSQYVGVKELVLQAKNGEALESLILPESIKVLALNGNFPNLSIYEAPQLQSLHVSGEFSDKKLDLSSLPKLESFVMSAGEPANWQQAVLSPNLVSFELIGEYPKLTSITGATKLRQARLTGKYPSLKLSINNWQELTELNTAIANFSSPHLDWRNYRKLSRISLTSLGESNCQSLTLPDSAEELVLSGNFSNLHKINFSPNLSSLYMRGSFGIQNMELPDVLQSFTYDDEADMHPQIKLNPALQGLEINSKAALGDMLNYLPDLISLKLDGADISDVTSLNLPQICPQLRELELMDTTMENLRELIVPSQTKFVSLNQSNFPRLEKLDLSLMPLKQFGVITSNFMDRITISSMSTDNNIKEDIKLADDGFTILNPMKLQGMVCQETALPNLKEIKYPSDVEKISFALCQFDPYEVVDFKSYPNLKEIETPDLKHIDMKENNPQPQLSAPLMAEHLAKHPVSLTNQLLGANGRINGNY